MPKSRRTLLDDKMEAQYLIPRTATTFKAAFPGVKTVRVEITERGDGVRFGPQGHPLVTVVTETSLRPALDCSNRRCQQGGVDIERLLQMLTYARTTDHQETIFCCGHEGSPKGRHRGPPCENSFQLNISITYET